MEIFALAARYCLVEHEVSRETVRTDCGSARQVIHGGYARLQHGDCAQRVLLQRILRTACTTELLPVWAERHAHKRKKDRNTWTIEDWGNRLAG